MEYDWSVAEKETYLARVLFEMFNLKITAYEAIAEHQGSLVPKLLAAVDLEISTPEPVDAPDCGDFDPFV